MPSSIAGSVKKFAPQVWIWLTLSVIGLYDTILLTIEHFTRRGLPCSFTGGCERVLTSKYSVIFGIPTALFGVIFNLLVLFLMIEAISNRQNPSRRIMLAWGSIGFLSSIGLTFLQAFVIRAWCQYCLLSALTSTLIFFTAIWYWRSTSSNQLPTDTNKENIDEA